MAARHRLPRRHEYLFEAHAALGQPRVGIELQVDVDLHQRRVVLIAADTAKVIEQQLRGVLNAQAALQFRAREGERTAAENGRAADLVFPFEQQHRGACFSRFERGAIAREPAAHHDEVGLPGKRSIAHAEAHADAPARSRATPSAPRAASRPKIAALPSDEPVMYALPCRPPTTSPAA